MAIISTGTPVDWVFMLPSLLRRMDTWSLLDPSPKPPLTSCTHSSVTSALLSAPSSRCHPARSLSTITARHRTPSGRLLTLSSMVKPSNAFQSLLKLSSATSTHFSRKMKTYSFFWDCRPQLALLYSSFLKLRCQRFPNSPSLRVLQRSLCNGILWMVALLKLRENLFNYLLFIILLFIYLFFNFFFLFIVLFRLRELIWVRLHACLA